MPETTFNMPSLGADMESGTVVQWLVKPGAEAHRGDAVVVVETDKGLIDVEVFHDAVFKELLAKQGEKLPVGAPLARIESAEGEAAAPPPRAAAPTGPAAARAPTPSGVGRRSVRASPRARARAKELGIDLADVVATGPGGAVSVEDVERAAGPAAPAPPPPAEARGEPIAMRRAIAAAMSRSKREIPHYYLSQIIDMKPSLDWLARENATRAVEERLLYAVLLVKAVALAVREVPEMNGYYRDGTFERRQQVNVGFATTVRGGGLINPALFDVGSVSVTELMARLGDLVKRARAGHLRGSEMTEATLTVTSLGERGVETVFPIIHPPQVAIVGFGRIEERPWVVDGRIEPRPVITATLGADHRVSDGHRGGIFLSAVEQALQRPEAL